jgi:aspartyl-tRNA synthetase
MPSAVDVTFAMTASSSDTAKAFTSRTHWCGDLTQAYIGQTVTLNGWVSVNRDLGGLIFIEVRDRTGLLQIVADPHKNPEVHKILAKAKTEAVITATGPITQRPEDTYNDHHPTGTIEIYPTHVEILNSAKPLPFQLDDDTNNVDELLRLKYRYLDLRRPRDVSEHLKHAPLIWSRHDPPNVLQQRTTSVEVETPFFVKADARRRARLPGTQRAFSRVTFYALTTVAPVV